MGMSASQARLLALTNRMHDVEYQAQNIQAKKLQLANFSDAAYTEYLNALDGTTLTIKQPDNTLVAATFNNLCSSENIKNAGGKHYSLMDDQGRLVVEQEVYDTYKNGGASDAYEFAALMMGIDPSYFNETAGSGTTTSIPVASTYVSSNLPSFGTINGDSASEGTEEPLPVILGEETLIQTPMVTAGFRTAAPPSAPTPSAPTLTTLTGSALPGVTSAGLMASPAANPTTPGLPTPALQGGLPDIDAPDVLTSAIIAPGAFGAPGAFVATDSTELPNVPIEDIVIEGPDNGAAAAIPDSPDATLIPTGTAAIPSLQAGTPPATPSNVTMPENSNMETITVVGGLPSWGVLGGTIGASTPEPPEPPVTSTPPAASTPESDSVPTRAIDSPEPEQPEKPEPWATTIVASPAPHAPTLNITGPIVFNWDNGTPSITPPVNSGNATEQPEQSAYDQLEQSAYDQYASNASSGNYLVSAHDSIMQQLNQYGPVSSIFNDAEVDAALAQMRETNPNGAANLETLLENFKYDFYRTQGSTVLAAALGTEKDNIDMPLFNYYANIYKQIEACGDCVSIETFNSEAQAGAANSNEWLNQQLVSGRFTLESYSVNSNGQIEMDSAMIGAETSVSFSNTTEIDKTQLAKAEAKYEKAMKDINTKEKRYDQELTKLDTERQALSSQMDSLKTQISDNIDSTFGIFS